MVAENLKVVIEAEVNKAIRDLKKAEQQTGKTAGGFKNLVKSLIGPIGVTAAVGLSVKAIANFTKQSIQAASDAQEIGNRFNTVFGGISDAAEDAAQNLSDNFGVSRQAAQDLLASTGDLLTGFGFTQKAALDLSDQANQLAIDLASFTNVPIEQSSRAITSALTGETEALKSLGIVVRQGTKDFQDRVAALQESEGITESQARAQVILAEAYAQSGNAIGDFARSSDSLANTQRTTQAAVENLSASLGSLLVPATTRTNAAFGDLVHRIDLFVAAVSQVEEIDRLQENLDESARDLVETYGSLSGAPSRALAQLRADAQNVVDVQIAYVEALQDSEEELTRVQRRNLAQAQENIASQTELITILDGQLEVYDRLQERNQQLRDVAAARAAEEARLAQALLDQADVRERINAALLPFASEQEQAVAAINAEIDALVALRTEARELGVTYTDLQAQINALVAERDTLIEGVDPMVAQARAALAMLADDTDFYNDRMVQSDQDAADRREAIARSLEQARTSLVSSFFTLATGLNENLQQDERKKAIAGKAIAAAETTINTAAAVAEAWPNIPLAIAAGAAGAAQLGVILSTPIPAAQMGGSFTVPPGANQDGGLLRVNSGERVDVTPSRQSGGGGVPDKIVVRIADRDFVAAVEGVFNKQGGRITKKGAIQTR